MYPTPLGVNFVVSQLASGAGAFTGADYGRAKLTASNADPNAVVRVAAKLYGALGNGYTLEFVDRGSGVAVTATSVQQIGTAIKVILRRLSTGSVLATAAEVAAAINAFTEFPFPIGAVAGGTGAGVVAAMSPTALASGVDPTSSPNVYRWGAANTNFGLFHFEQDSSILVRAVETKFTISSGTHSLTIARVPLNEAFEAVTAESIPVLVYENLTTSKPSFSVTDVEILVPPRWALTVVTSSALVGLVRMDAQRDRNT